MRIKAQDDATERIAVNFPTDVYHDLQKYREMLGESTKLNYVIVEAVRGFLRTDADFKKRKKNPAKSSGEAHAAIAPASAQTTPSVVAPSASVTGRLQVSGARS